MADNEEEGETNSPQARFWLTNDIMAGILVVVLCGLVFLDAVWDLSVPKIAWTAFVLSTSVAVVWLFGSKAASRILN